MISVNVLIKMCYEGGKRLYGISKYYMYYLLLIRTL